MADFFCLDLGEDQIRIAEITKRGSLFDALNLGILEMDPLFYRTDSENLVEKLADSLSKGLEKLKLKQKQVAIIIPDSFSYNRFIEMPKLNEKELMSAIRYQADQFIPMPLDEVELDIEIIYENPTTKKTLVLLSSAPKTIIEKVKKLSEYTGLIPISIEPETSSVGRFFSETYKKTPPSQTVKNQSQGFVLINVGFSSTTLYYFDQNLNLVTYSRNFNTGYNLFLKEIQVNLNVDTKKAGELLKNFGLAASADYHLETVLAPSLKDLLTKIDNLLKEIVNTHHATITNLFLFNDALKFNSLETIFGKFFALPTGFLNLAQFFSKNRLVDFYKNDFDYFLAAAGGSVR